nr:DinB family protein [Candidatus Sigynarchaeota archaeon]
MKDIFQFLAKYNKLTNQAMVQILEKVPSKDLVKDTGAFYKSILGTLNHLMGADIGWLGRVIEGIPDLADLAGALPKISYGRKPSEGLQWGTLAEFKNVRGTVDGVIVDMIERIPADKFCHEITFKNYRGEIHTKMTWYVLLHIFNHETHHRGVISTLLDQMGVENDYSNVNRIPI